MVKAAVNGMGRIGRAVFKILLEQEGVEITAVNDPISAENLAYLLRYDSVYGRYEKEVSADNDYITVSGRPVKFLSEKDPEKLPWKELGADVVFECSGFFTTQEGMGKHLKAGASKVLLSAPSKSKETPTVVHGVNSVDKNVKAYSTASCTTNCAAPVMEIMGRRIGVEKALMTTVHAYTSSQSAVDSPSKKLRRGRAAAVNFVPTSTGAAKAAAQTLPQFKGLFDGVAVRGPVPCGSITDIVMAVSRDTTAEEINSIFKEESETDRYKGIVGIADDDIVSSDILRDPRASIIDQSMTKVTGWYDNEWGYAAQMVKEGLK
ncbi:MAG: type I glyceraldehyde-3-phosphate dehydrogenase [bacterium]